MKAMTPTERNSMHDNTTMELVDQPTSLKVLTDQAIKKAFEIITGHTSKNTQRARVGDIIYWKNWLRSIGFSFERPISEQEIITFVIHHLGKDKTHKLATIKSRIDSLSVFLDQKNFPNPCRNKPIRQLLIKLTKIHGTSKPAGKAITKDILDDMLDTCKDKLIDIRDRAILLFAWGSGGRRRSEVADAQIKDLIPTSDGEYTYNIPKSKTDQSCKGHIVPIKGRVAYALTQWLSISGITEGPIFRSVRKGDRLGNGLWGDDLYCIVRKRLKKAGYDHTQYGAHSLRSGFVTEAGRRGKPLGDVMQMTTHKNVAIVMKYYQAGNINNNSAANLAD